MDARANVEEFLATLDEIADRPGRRLDERAPFP